MSLAVPTQGILRISSPPSTEDPKIDQVAEASDFDKCDQDINQSEGAPKIDCDPEVCLPNTVILTETQDGAKRDESVIRKGNFAKRKLSYNARSDTVLEMCNSEDISFIDEDPCDIIVDDNPGDVTKDDNDDNQVDSDNLNNMQQIVIKINNEIELTSIIVNTHNQSQGGRLDLSRNLSLQEDTSTEDLLPSPTTEEAPIQDQKEECPGAESSVTPQMFCTVTSEKEHGNVSENSLGDKLSFYQAVRSTRFLTRRRRNVLVRQEKLDCDFHPGLARKRHSFVPESQPRHHHSRRIRKTASL